MYSEPCQTSKKKLFSENRQLLNIRQGIGCAYIFCNGNKKNDIVHYVKCCLKKPMDMFFLSEQKFQISISFTSFTKSLVMGTLALLFIFNGKDNKMVF